MSQASTPVPASAPTLDSKVAIPPALVVEADAPSSNDFRETWIDQARWVAIALVVTGHFAGLVRGRSELARTYSDFVYIFHIPVLVLLAGWGSRRANADAAGLTKIFWQLLVPYVIFQNVAFAMNYLLNDDAPSWSFVEQTFGLWFLVALAGWRLLGPWFRGFRQPALMALALALIAGLSPQIEGLLSLSRVLFFLPMFVAGPWVVDRIGGWRRERRLRTLAGAVLVAAAGWVTLSEPLFDRTIFFGREGYASLHQGVLEGMAYRTGAIAVSTALAIALCLVLPGQPGAKSPLGALVARAGRYTMYPYLIHLPLLIVLGWAGWAQKGEPLPVAVAAISLGLVVSIVTVSPPVRALTRILVEPRSIVGSLTARLSRRR
jgi:fucose 4-O-acetylase-like acetyltransferase